QAQGRVAGGPQPDPDVCGHRGARRSDVGAEPPEPRARPELRATTERGDDEPAPAIARAMARLIGGAPPPRPEGPSQACAERAGDRGILRDEVVVVAIAGAVDRRPDVWPQQCAQGARETPDRKSTRLNSSHVSISY